MTRATGVVGGSSAGTFSPAGSVEDGVTKLEREVGGRPHLPNRTLLAAALGVTLLPLLVSGIALLLKEGNGFTPIGDYAQIELRVRDVGPRTPLVGLWSRDDWSHPGPLGLVVLAPVYRLLGSASIGTYLGALVVNGAALSGVALVARRRGGTPLMLCTLVVCGLMVTNLGADYVRSPWNPYLPVLSYGLLILLAWSMACGEIWALPLAVVVASFAAQTHIGFVALGLPLVAWGLGGLVWSVLRSPPGPDADAAPQATPDDATDAGSDATARPQPDRRRYFVSAVLLSVAVAAVLWLPPLLDTLGNHPANVDRIVQYFSDPDQSAHSLLEGWRVMAAQFSLEAEWLSGRQPLTVTGESPFLYSLPLPWLLVPLVGAGVVLCRWNRPGDRALVGTLLVAFGTGMVAISRTIGPVADYRLQPTWWPGALAGAMALWVAWRAVSARWASAERRWLVPLAGAALVVLAGVNSVSAVRSDVRHTADSQVMAHLVPEVLEAVGPGEGEVVVMGSSGPWTYYTEAVVLQLERHGIDATVLPSRISELRYGRHRVHEEEDDPLATLVVVPSSEEVDRWATDPDLVPIATWSEDEDPIDSDQWPLADQVVVFQVL